MFPIVVYVHWLQCRKVNHVRLVLEHFKERPIRRMIVEEGRSLSVECNVPHGIPSPSVFWLYRDTVQTSIIETIRRPHIAVDPQGILSYYLHFVLERYAIFHIIHKRSKYINTGRNGQNCRDYRWPIARVSVSPMASLAKGLAYLLETKWSQQIHPISIGPGLKLPKSTKRHIEMLENCKKSTATFLKKFQFSSVLRVFFLFLPYAHCANLF